MELEPQMLANSNVNMFQETMFYDALSQNNYILSHYQKPENEHTDMLKQDENVLKSEINDTSNNSNLQEPSNQNMSHILTLPINLMVPPPPKMINYDNDFMKKYQSRENNSATGRRDSYRPISPKEYDSDENCTVYSFKDIHPDIGIKCSDSRYGLYRLGEQTIMFGKYSHSSPNIYSSIHYSPNQGPHNNGHFKNRYTNNGSNNNNTNGTGDKNGRQKQNNINRYKPGVDIIVRRAHGLVERFKSRAELLKIDPNPPGLLNGGPWDQLNQAIWDVFISKAQTEHTYEIKISLWKHIFLEIRKCLTSYGLFMVGSTMSGFGLDSSDIDMCLLTKPCTSDPRLDALHHLNSVRHILVKYGFTAEPELILAKVPILKFKDKETGFEIDLNCNNSVGIRNTHLLHCYARLDWRVRPLVVIVKLWAQANNINDAKNMTVSSYSWSLMVIHYLQCGMIPPVLPCLHGLVPEKFNSDSENHTMDVQEEILSIKDFKSDNIMCLGELLQGFFEYFSAFNYNEYAVSVRTGSKLLIDECRFTKAPKNDPNQWKYLCIEEPFDHTNTARSVFDLDMFKHIRNIIVASYEELLRSRMLSNILPVNMNQNQS